MDGGQAHVPGQALACAEGWRARCREALVPFADRPPVDAQFHRRHLVRHNTLGAVRDHAGTFGQGTPHLPSATLTFQESPLRPARDQGRPRPTDSAHRPTNHHSRSPMII